MSNFHNMSPIITTPDTPTASGSGTFAIGTTASHFFFFTDIWGSLYDPSNLSIEIFEPGGGSETTADTLDRIELGVYAFTWSIPANADTGKYTATVTYTNETIDGTTTDTFSEEFVVTESGSGTTTLRVSASRSYLESIIGEMQRIPIQNNVLRFNKALTIGTTAFPRIATGRWNQPAGVKVYRNGDLMETGFSVDYWKGRVTFDNPISKYDEVTIDFNMRWFTDEELDAFIEQGINRVNIYPPASAYNIETIPDAWIIVGLYGAAVDVYRRWMGDILFQEPAIIFGGMDRADKIFGHMESLKKNFEEDFYKLIEQKKFGPYTGLTMTVTMPEYTLPGGRSRWFRYLFKGGG